MPRRDSEGPGAAFLCQAIHEDPHVIAQGLLLLRAQLRDIGHIIDGIRCHCGCADLNGHYSLLSCYEGEDAMAKICPICQGEGRVAARLAKAGKSLDEIRVAIDAQFG